jgi:5-methyltetrahydropteroyltriglutamate--homocysteine methyltransferase
MEAFAVASSRTPSNAIDHVGSLKRPPGLVAAWRAWEAGTLAVEELREVQDRAICDAIKMQEDLDLPIVTDGEFRRAGWSRGFLSAVEGLEFAPSKLLFRSDDGFVTASPAPIAVSKVRRVKPIVTEDFKFISTVARRPVKITMPTPSHMHFGHFKDAVNPTVYPDIEVYWDDLVSVFQRELKELYAAGCRHVQLDEVPLALLCDQGIRSLAKSEGGDPVKLVDLYIDVLNRAIAKRPADLTIGMHLCRGNMEGLWMGDGGYDPIAEALFARTDVDSFLLEYDSQRAGDFTPLRYLPSGKRAYLGIISTKTPVLERPDDLMRRIEEASHYAPMERLGICPQCGFSSAAMSKFAVLPSKVTTDIQTLKIKLLVDTGRRAWGRS